MCRKKKHKNNDDEEPEEEPENIDKCPECQTITITRNNNNEYEYCEKCGLITRASYDYTAGIRIDLPYGVFIK